MATARSQPKPKTMVANPFGTPGIALIDLDTALVAGLMMNPRQRPALIQATRAATAFTAGIALPNGYT